MKPKILLLAALTALALTGGYWLGQTRQAAASSDSAGSEPGDRKVLYWYDPMSPGTRFEKPGKSPFMDMDLVPRYADEAQEEGGVQISPRQQQNLGVRTATVSRQEINFAIEAFGSVAVDERSITSLSAPANGVVEKLWVSAPQQQVQKNQPLAQLWLPQWSASQQEFLAVRQLGDAALSRAARTRLQLQFMPEEVIRAVERTGKPQTRFTLRAPHAGYVSRLDVRAGAQVNASQPLLEIAMLDPVWIVAEYQQSQASQLTVGSRVTATTRSWPGKTFQGAVSELLPELNAATRTLKARITLENPDTLLRPGMYLNVRLAQPTTTSLLAIPQEALITTGSSNRVLLADGDGYFRPQEVTAGRVQNGWVEILSGLSEGERIVTSGQFLIDSEASLHSALPQMAAEPAASSWSAEGEIKAIHDDSITIAHQAIPELKWAAMTMDFAVTAQQRQLGKPGDKVKFTFTLDEEGARIISITPMSTGHKESL